MKAFFLIAIFLFSTIISFGQQQIDSVSKFKMLEEVVVFAKKKKKKSKSFKTQGWPAYKNLDQHDKHVNLIKGYPKGKITYVEFYFNTGLVNLMKDKLDINYQDVDVQLLVYKVKEDSLIGESLLPSEFVFTVNKVHNGAYRISLADFNIREEQIFIGIAVVGETKKGETNIYVRMNEKQGAIGYEQHALFPKWQRISDGEIFKLKIGIEQ